MMMCCVLVIGGVGFLGLYFIDVLFEWGYEVFCVDNFFIGSK